ncbi:MAG: DUF2970 domain-containing protein [Methylococcales bacterium]|nr:DUF2970 domain-containing protein [Methylococcales bacterium]MCK5924400.1 DUF2970 domain-containing protein [Methylococcales bacterium]
MSKPTFFQIVKSVFSAFIGIQSKANRTQDFAGGSPSSYIFVGIGFTLLFIFVIIAVVNLVV